MLHWTKEQSTSREGEREREEEEKQSPCKAQGNPHSRVHIFGLWRVSDSSSSSSSSSSTTNNNGCLFPIFLLLWQEELVAHQQKGKHFFNPHLIFFLFLKWVFDFLQYPHFRLLINTSKMLEPSLPLKNRESFWPLWTSSMRLWLFPLSSNKPSSLKPEPSSVFAALKMSPICFRIIFRVSKSPVRIPEAPMAPHSCSPRTELSFLDPPTRPVVTRPLNASPFPIWRRRSWLDSVKTATKKGNGGKKIIGNPLFYWFFFLSSSSSLGRNSSY